MSAKMAVQEIHGASAPMVSVSDILDITFERVVELAGDPKDRIYARLFELHPEFERLFVMDVDGGVRGSMLQTSLNCMMGVARNEAETSRFLIEAARMIHDGYGISDDEVDSMFLAIRDTFREILGKEWSDEIDLAWTGLLEELSTIGKAQQA